MDEGQRIHSMFIDVDGDHLVHQYMCREGDEIPPLTIFSKRVLMDDLRSRVRSSTDSILTRGSSTSSDSAFRELGGALYDQAIPAGLAERLQTDSDDSYLVLYLDPALVWIPWELLWDGEQFLSGRFRVSRFLQKTAHELRAADERLRERRSGRGALIVFGDTSGLQADNEKTEVENALAAAYGANIWFHRARTASEVLGELKKDYEICHFIGHGRHAPETPDETGWICSGGTFLTCRDIEGVSSRSSFPLLVFANSCDSAHPSFSEREGYVSALYHAFLKRGVPHYIGTIAPVPDEPAKEFARFFYRLIANGSTVGEALHDARRALSNGPGMPAAAFYVHYGDPTFQFVGVRDARQGRAERSPETLREESSFSVFSRLSKEEIYRRLKDYRSQTKKNPDDGEAHYGLAMCYLQVELFDEATTNFKRAVDLAPDHADAHYYYGLSIIRARKPKLLSLSEVRLIEEHLQAAMRLDDRPAKYYYLAAILKFDYYLANGLLCRPPSPEELLLLAEDKEHDAWEVERLLHFVPVPDTYLISRIPRAPEAFKR